MKSMAGSVISTYLSHTLHGAADLFGHSVEPVQVPSWDLGHDVVQTGLEAGRGRLGGGVLDLGEGDS